MDNLVRVSYSADELPPLTEAEIREIEEAAKAPIVYDDDCPKQTAVQLKKFRRVKGDYGSKKAV